MTDSTPGGSKGEANVRNVRDLVKDVATTLGNWSEVIRVYEAAAA